MDLRVEDLWFNRSQAFALSQNRTDKVFSDIGLPMLNSTLKFFFFSKQILSRIICSCNGYWWVIFWFRLLTEIAPRHNVTLTLN